MSLIRCKSQGRNGWQYGPEGTCYTGPGAKQKAADQGMHDEAMKASLSEADIRADDAVRAVMDARAAEDGHVAPAGAKAEAQRGLDWHKEHGRGGTPVGLARARDIANGSSLPIGTIARMVSFFARHEVDKQGKGWSPGDGFPSNGRIAWALWGGDPGRSWANKIWKQHQKATAELLVAYIPQADRDQMDEADFAGPDRSYPIRTADDVQHAASLVGHAADPAAVKRKIISIARRKGLSLPKAWENEP